MENQQAFPLKLILAGIVLFLSFFGWKFWKRRDILKKEEKKKNEIEAEIAKSKAKSDALKAKVKKVKKSKT